MDEIHVHKTKKSICAHFAESPCTIASAEHRAEARKCCQRFDELHAFLIKVSNTSEN